MKLLLDANISWRLTTVLKQYFTDCFHVDDIGLAVPASDAQIWEYAKENDCVIVTKDEDFIDYVNIKGFPPKVVLLKTGNQSRLFISNLLISRKEDIHKLVDSSDLGLLEIL